MDLNTATNMMQAAITSARANNQHIAICVTDSHGELLCFSRMDDASLQAGVLAKTKAYTAARERQSTRQLGAWAQNTGKDMGYWNDQLFTGIAGGVPVFIDTKCVGAVGVSGLSELEDEALAMSAIECQHLAR
ncbi:heme-binding protein [Paraglaciecola sp. 20A4]|uniref:GlcG/HbpS family heme-binding protein n=1 Tax=Paraglaciecola sp. 20A4 TaxID=2687288 RepID=UPI00140A73F0|nr:heme-binding protein [Paraglaciecola sp. 20A4]